MNLVKKKNWRSKHKFNNIKMGNMVAVGRRLFGKDELQFRVIVWIQLDADNKGTLSGESANRVLAES